MTAEPSHSAPFDTAKNPASFFGTQESQRLTEPYEGPVQPWRKWGPYVCERSWGSVREDYSPHGTAWEYFPHDHARSKAYRWGEDGIAGICDRYQILVFALALWNGKDPILKERMFGLSGNEGKHGEDVKEYWFYLDNTPTHSYMRMLYKYPQAAFPYQQLIEENNRRGASEGEYELLDTGIFDEDRYFDVVVEYAKSGPEDICIRMEAFNRGPDPAEIHLLPQLWFRKTWGWNGEVEPQPVITQMENADGAIVLCADDSAAKPPASLRFPYRLGKRFLYAAPGGEPLFTNNETNDERLYGSQNSTPYVKDAFHRSIVGGEDSTNPLRVGTKSGIHYRATIAPGDSFVVRLRLTPNSLREPMAEVDAVVAQRRADADEFYAAVQPPQATPEEKVIQRQALAGMLWSKQIYLFDVQRWLEGDNPASPPPESRKHRRNTHWRHLNSMRVMTMPDKWEFPWFAAWDLAFQCVTLALVDVEFAKGNLWDLLFEQFLHPNGQIPAYEWEYSDINPPVHAWACWRVYQQEKAQAGRGDSQWLEKCFHKLLINFAWWVNRVDSEGNNVFEGGFLGLDNITVIDRGAAMPDGATLEQSDATGWMGHFCLYMMRIALELAKTNAAYEGLATKFFQHFIYIGAAMKRMGGRDYQLWDEADGFFYDVLRYPNGEFKKFRLRSAVGLIPLFAVEVLDRNQLVGHPTFLADLDWFFENRADLVGHACFRTGDSNQRYVLSIVDPCQLKRVMERVGNPDEFLSEHGVRSLSRVHRDAPFVFGDRSVKYEPGEADGKLMGGNSNWRGPIWFPTTYLLMQSLLRFDEALGAEFRVSTSQSPSGTMSLSEMSADLGRRMIGIFKRDGNGIRPSAGKYEKFQQDPHWRDCILFHEYYHGDTGMGLGASHQTGWSGLVANMIDEWCR